MAKKKGEARMVIRLACTQCKDITYTTYKNRRNDPGRLEIKKHCPRCGTHVPHREVKK